MNRGVFLLIMIFFVGHTVYSQCEPISIFPWTEGFENNDFNLPLCWKDDVMEGTGWEWKVVEAITGSPSTTQTGNYKVQAYKDFEGLPVYYTKLISPVFDLSALDNPILTFYHAQFGGSGHLAVNYKNSINGELKSLAVFVDEVTNWTKEIISLPEKSNYYQIIFEATFLGGGIIDIQLDDISIAEPDNVGIVSDNVHKIKIYPNPVKDVIFIEYDENVQIKLFDVMGNKVLSKTVVGKPQININYLPQGVYILNSYSNDIFIEQRKIVKF